MTEYRESILEFGDNNHLLGIVTQPNILNPGKPWVVLLNAGVLHHAGPFRMNTDLARHLSTQGIGSLRMDFSGIGDSNLGGSSLGSEERYIAELQTALDELDQLTGQKNTYVVMGLCTGADNAHKAAVHDNRVTGIICLDGYAYPTWRYRLNNLLPRITRTVTSPAKLVKAVINRLKPSKQAPQQSEDYLFRWYLPDKQRTVEEWQSMLQRGAYLLMIYTSGTLAFYRAKK